MEPFSHTFFRRKLVKKFIAAVVVGVGIVGMTKAYLTGAMDWVLVCLMLTLAGTLFLITPPLPKRKQ